MGRQMAPQTRRQIAAAAATAPAPDVERRAMGRPRLRQSRGSEATNCASLVVMDGMYELILTLIVWCLVLLRAHRPGGSYSQEPEAVPSEEEDGASEQTDSLSRGARALL